MSVEPEHWFDRLAAPHTRRQGLKAALATAALTLPFLRSGPARAANPNARGPHDCQIGCFYASHKQYARQNDTCQSAAAIGGYQGLVTVLFGLIPFGFAQQGAAAITAVNCHDQALLRQKAMQYDCLQADCPGFDPDGPDGPCEPCALLRATGQNCVCCPDPVNSPLVGYLYCARCNPETGHGCG